MKVLPKKDLSLFDSTSLIVGIIIGVGIYQMAPDIAKGAGSWWGVMAIWLVGGLLSLFGALGYAELASAYPQEGGDYVYLTKAFGKWAGFLFGWVQLSVVRPGDIAVLAFAFALYANKLYAPFENAQANQICFASLAIVLLSAINILGVKEGKWTQNLLTVIKALGLLAILGVALVGSPRSGQVAVESVGGLPVSVALVMVLFTFGGWNEMAYVAAEVKNPSRNIVRALVLGTTAVTVLYLLANVAFLYTLGYEGMANSGAVAADTLETVFPKIGGRLISALICISALGAVNGLIFTGARISYAVGGDHRAFRPLGRWNAKTGTPLRSLALQALIAVALVVLLGSFKGIVLYTAGAVYSFYLATSLAVMVLRSKEPGAARPYRVTGYPVTTIIFGIVCTYLIYSSITFTIGVDGIFVAIAPFAIMLAGLPLYWLTTPRRSDVKGP
jgi:APA family basic amino acid/polyamine antiporter